MTARSHSLLRTLSVILLTVLLSACQTRTIEVTRVKIMERHVIERVIVTVEVTRVQRVVETPRPTLDETTAPNDDPNLEPSPSPLSPTATPTRSTSGSTFATATPPSSAKVTGERLLAAIKDMEQRFLSLVQALNSDPLPRAQVIEFYVAIKAAPTFDIPENEAELQSIYLRYREQVDYVIGQGSDLYTHLVQIEAGEAENTVVSSIHLGVARDGASAGTSNLQGLMRELETLLTSQP